MGPGKKVLYLGAASGTTVSHVSDIVGPVSFLFFVRTGCPRSGKKSGKNIFFQGQGIVREF